MPLSPEEIHESNSDAHRELAAAINRLADMTAVQQRFLETVFLALPAKTRAQVLGVGKRREKTLRQRLQLQRIADGRQA